MLSFQNLIIILYECLVNILLLSLRDKHSSRETTYVYANDSNFTNKNFRKAVMAQTNLHNEFRKKRTEERNLHKKRRHH